MRIAIDMLGGDHAPEALLQGVAESAAKHPEREYLAVGTPDVLEQLPQRKNIIPVPCGSCMAMDEDVRNFMRKKDSSIWVATELVKKGEADAVVSAGSTGAQMAVATVLLSRIPGVSRPAIGVVVPSNEGGKLLLDIGANPDCDGEILVQFAKMGAVYAECILDKESPRIALLSNGSEDHKGSAVTKAAFALLKNSNLNFIGNREGRDILYGGYDVMVADGMSGNIALKCMEGAAGRIMGSLKEELSANILRKLGAALIMSGLKRVKKSLDYQEYGGAPLLGVKGVSIVCHGSSKERAIVQGIEVAATCVEKQMVQKLAERIAGEE